MVGYRVCLLASHIPQVTYVNPIILITVIGEISVTLFYLYSGIRAWHFRRKTDDSSVRNIYMGIIMLCAAIQCKGAGISIAMILFWEDELNVRVLFWQGQVFFAYLAWYYLFRRDFIDLRTALKSQQDAATIDSRE